jgi:hypothetical protein
MALQNIGTQYSDKVIIHNTVEVVKLVDKGMLDPICNRLPYKQEEHYIDVRRYGFSIATLLCHCNPHNCKQKQGNVETLSDLATRKLEQILSIEFLEHEGFDFGEVVENQDSNQRMISRIDGNCECGHMHEI